jgi:hypothetical protein
VGQTRWRSDHDHLFRSSSSTFMASRLAFYLTLFLFFSVNTLSLRYGAYTHISCVQISLVTAKAGKWEATSFCKCIPALSPSCGQNAEPKIAGVCFGTSYKILHLDFPDNPNKPCLSCTKQWCLNQNLPICAGATLGDANPDTATGKEGDVEARCFREYSCSRPCSGYLITVASCD